MNSGDLMWEKLHYLKNELTNLKTATVKTASRIATTSASLSLHFSLAIEPLSTSMDSTKRAIITMQSTDGTDMLVACYASGITPANLDQRFLFIQKAARSSVDGVATFEVAVNSQNPNDFNTLSQGGSVELDYNIVVVGTSKFNASVSYIDVLGA